MPSSEWSSAELQALFEKDEEAGKILEQGGDGNRKFWHPDLLRSTFIALY